MDIADLLVFEGFKTGFLRNQISVSCRLVVRVILLSMRLSPLRCIFSLLLNSVNVSVDLYSLFNFVFWSAQAAHLHISVEQFLPPPFFAPIGASI